MSLYSFLSQFNFLVRVKKSIDSIELQLFHVLQILRKHLRKTGLLSKGNRAHAFAILVIKRKEYLDMAIENVNSLHCYNSNHEVIIYSDSRIHALFRARKKNLHYPEKVRCINLYKNSKRAWQYAKVDALIHASKREASLVDADTIWHKDPSEMIDTERITFLVAAYPISQNRAETKLVTKVFKKPSWKSFTHYVTGFVHIPSSMLTTQLIKKMKENVHMLLKEPYSFLNNEDERQQLRRLAEEIGIGLAVQSIYPAHKITTLKETDGPGNKKVMQSLYYGCSEQIIE